MAAKHGLGRGLQALINDGTEPAKAPEKQPAGGATLVPVSKIRRNPFQPRREFNAEALAELTLSIRERGVLMPLIVRRVAEGFELIAGERRLRAAQQAGLAEVPVSVIQAADQDSLEVALIENLQRADLNVLEEAAGYQELADRFSLTQEQIATRVGKARATVTNSMRLLGLPDEVKALLSSGQLTPGHAKLIAGLEIPAEQVLLAKRVAKENIPVRKLEGIVQRLRQAPRKPRASRSDIPPEHLTYLSSMLHTHFGTGVRINPSHTYANGKKAKGSIEIDFYSNDDLDRILEILGVGDAQ